MRPHVRHLHAWSALVSYWARGDAPSPLKVLDGETVSADSDGLASELNIGEYLGVLPCVELEFPGEAVGNIPTLDDSG